MRTQVIIVATLLLSAALFAVNFAVAVASGSRAILAQAIFTLTDLVGSALLLWGLHLSRRPATHEYPFGRGKERFFWAFVSIVVTFTVAGVVALSEGVDQVVSPTPLSHIGEGLLVVGATILVSAASIWVTLRELRLSRQTLSSLLESANQGLKSIFYQDLVSIVASAVAFGGLIVVYRTGHPVADGVSAVVEGVLLIATGFVLTLESREYLIGRALAPEIARAMLAIVERNPTVAKVRSLQSMMLGPDDALLALRINFRDGMTTDQLESAIDQVGGALRTAYPVLRHVIIEPES
ncbi:MAG TPA: cation diffusion facilitator family transporter [Thermoplasmata archaeon]|nr:cation diffusion facilitator family transporter [Thermoplasmata archaeon]